MDVRVRLYINNALSSMELRSVLSRLQGPLNNAIRLNDPKFKTVDSSSLELSNLDSVVAFLTDHGHLMERPLLDTGSISCVGRPVELLLPLL